MVNDELVATVHTACGIVTLFFMGDQLIDRVATAHTACGIVTPKAEAIKFIRGYVATAHTACGIVTKVISLIDP